MMSQSNDKYLEENNEDHRQDINQPTKVRIMNHRYLEEYENELKEISANKQNKEIHENSSPLLQKRRDEIHKKADEYLQSVTLHGFTRVFTGHRIEAIFWLIVILTGLALIGLVAHNLIIKFNSRETYIKSQSELTDKNYLPAVTFCYNRISKTQFCSRHVASDVPGVFLPIPCLHSASISYMKPLLSITGSAIDAVRIWHNALFLFTCKGICDDKVFFAFKQTSESCVTWNNDGGIYSETGVLRFSIQLSNPSPKSKIFSLETIIHDPKIYGPVQEDFILMSSNNHYEVPIEKTMHKRLKAPFKTNCTSENIYNIFPKNYSRRACLDTMKCIESFKKCGDTYDFCYDLIPEAIRQKYKGDKIYQEAKQCIADDYKKIYYEHCPRSCEETTYRKYPSTYRTNQEKEDELFFQMKFVEPSTYDVIEEKELYNINQLFCESGGLLGLLLGGSVLSIIEILIYSALIVIKRCV